MPNMQLYICKGIPTDKTYNHVLRFQSDSSRFAYFTSKSVLHLTNYTYQRLEHYLSVGVNAETIEPCNYIVFQNADFSDKWYYAFIEKIEYVANETSRIYFTVDVMQTWFNQVTLQPCFIERSHTNTDEIGDNIINDELDTGPYIDDIQQYIDFDKRICIVTTFDKPEKDSPPASGSLRFGIYSGCKENFFTTAESANDFIAKAVEAGQAPDGILGIYMVPLTFDTGKYDKTFVVPNNVAGYVPKNNKLFTYPYFYLRYYSTQGDNHVFRFELGDRKKSLHIGYNVMSNAGQTTAIFAAEDYKGSTGYNQDDVFAISNWPTCAYNTDIYKVYVAQNSSSMAVENAGLVAGTMFAGINLLTAPVKDAQAMSGKHPSLFPDNTYGAIEGLANQMLNIASTLAKRDDMDRLPPQSHGSVSPYFRFTDAGILPTKDASAPYAMASYHHVTKEFAKVIDDYWTMFGYPIHQVQVPNIDSRRNWNYVKTQNCCCLGDVPADVSTMINDIFNRGVTFWHNPGLVGNYEADNSIYKRIPEVGE